VNFWQSFWVLRNSVFSGCCAPMMLMWEQWGLLSPLGAAELYREGSCCWRCFALTSLAILGHFPVSPDQQKLYLASSLRSSRRGLSAQCVSRPRNTRHFSGLFFCPSRAPAQCSCLAAGASRSQHRLSSFLLHRYMPQVQIQITSESVCYFWPCLSLHWGSII